MATSMTLPILSMTSQSLPFLDVHDLLLDIYIVLLIVQIFYGEANHGRVCTYIEDQQNCDCFTSVAADYQHYDTEPKK